MQALHYHLSARTRPHAHNSRGQEHVAALVACRQASSARLRHSRRVEASASLTTSLAVSSGSYVTKEARDAVFGVAKEQVTEAAAQVVSGRLPSWLRGSLLLNGCGDFRGMQHLFDGYACLSRVRLDGQDNRAWASQRFLDTDAYSAFRSTGRMKYREFQTPVPAEGPLGRAAAVLDNTMALMSKGRAFTDNASVSITSLPGGKLLALSETRSAAYLVDPDTLATLQQVEPADGLPGDLTTAHPKRTPDGRLVNFSRSLPFGGYHVYVQDPASLKRTQIAFIRDRDPLAPCWVHDMAVTRTHLVVVEAPVFINMQSLVLGEPRPYVFMDWRPEDGTRVHVIALDGSGVVTHTAPALFTFHFSNAFERPSASSPGATELCVDFSVYDDPAILNDLSLKEMMDMPGKDISPSRLRRLTMPLRDAAGKPAGPARLDAPAPLLRDESAYGNFVEFPAFNTKFAGLPYRYCYSTAAVRPTNMGNALAVHDLQEGTSRLWHSPGGMPAEPCFVPRPGSSDEADGVVLAAVVGADGGSSVVVLEGGSLQELARVKLPVTVPYRFHGTFVQQK
ncbi:hypothetical protein CHLRE_02g073900v5 [Chlamydomonas reinhardtii]|uniref:Uncharacterized protein n=1 Tax=Chlamydomonas reinhardtii TaxID=3055 RepID=A8I9T9_CHLRE|nr:uncharacterized protein CHLRE_02g073900v5 [Chlamydomonas reinhardtii]PNW86115.1 hypothetical protein CHLRE_02g073900v5 [Chlamydomonas reinhardtii]|eukprot:XP_001701620.1 predicted protein [Chlamydomonas reinhardtii]